MRRVCPTRAFPGLGSRELRRTSSLDDRAARSAEVNGQFLGGDDGGVVFPVARLLGLARFEARVAVRFFFGPFFGPDLESSAVKEKMSSPEFDSERMSWSSLLVVCAWRRSC